MTENLSQNLTNGTPLQPNIVYTETQLMRALYDVQDILERALCPYILLDDIARSIHDKQQLEGHEITIGILKKNITKEVLSTFNFYLQKSKNVQMNEDGFTYEWDTVPIHVKYITNNYQFFKNLDFRFYMANEYKIANPWEEYWKMRLLIK